MPVEVESDSSLDEVLPISKRRCLTREKGYRFVFKPPTPAWQKSACKRFGLNYVKLVSIHSYNKAELLIKALVISIKYNNNSIVHKYVGKSDTMFGLYYQFLPLC